MWTVIASRGGWLVAATAAPLLVACHGGAASQPAISGTPTDGASPPADVLTRHAGAMKPLLFENHAAYLYVHRIEPYGDTPDPAPALPDCVENDLSCWQTMPADADQVARFGPLPSSLTVITATGPCTAQVAPVVVVNTSGCEPSQTYAAPLAGCGAALAPVAFAATDVAPDLRWLPTPPVKTTPLPADASALRDPLQRRYVTTWMTSGSLAGTRRDGHTGVVSVDAGAEALTTIVAGALVGDSADECELSAATEEVLGLRRGDQFTELHLEDGYEGTVTEWDGALAWHGQVVGVVSGNPHSVDVHAVGPGAAATPLFSAHIWSDNEECTQGTWSGVEYPCGP